MEKLRNFVSRMWPNFSYETDYFFGLDLFYVLAGVRLDSQNERFRRWWSYYRVIILVVNLLMIWRFVRNVSDWENIGIVLNSVQVELSSLVSLLRAFLIGWHYESLTAARKFLNRRQFGRDLAGSREARSESYQQVRRLVTALIISQVAAVIPIAILNLDGIDTLKPPFDLTGLSPLVHLVCKKIYGFGMMTFAWIVGLNFLAVCMILSGLGAEFRVLNKSLETIMDRVDKLVEDELDAIPERSNSDQGKPKISKRDTYERPLFWKFFNTEFNKCIQQHQELFAFLDTAKPLLNANFLLAYYTTVLTIACGVVFLLFPNKNYIFTVQVLYFTTLMLTECLVFSWLVDKITELNESVGSQVYDLDWPMKLPFDKTYHRQYRAARHALLFVMIRSQQPLGLNCGGFFEFTMEKFAELINMAYSLVMFFRNFV